jgi:hypothetical protein
MVPFSDVDPDFAKSQLILFLREWYMHPNGQIPAYEWACGDVNPPVHAWAAWRGYKIEKRVNGKADRRFLERVFQKLLLNFTWWVNRKDADGHNEFQGGFLGLDNIGGMGVPLWDEEDEFFYDVLHLLALVRGHRMKRLLKRMLDPEEFLGEYGIRAISRYHLEHPYRLEVEGAVHEVRYGPGESSTGLFSGNSNWRGPIWFPINFLIFEAIQNFHYYFGDDFLIEYPTGSGEKRTLWQIAAEISSRLESIFLRASDGRRPEFGDVQLFQEDPQWRDHVPFHEYFHGDSGRGVGANHQTGWTGVVAKLLEQTATQMLAPRDMADAREPAHAAD